jgi:hypothetical protein
VSDSVLKHPVIIAHGRIVVLGGDNHRLHEEVITAGGAIIEGRFNRLNVGDTKDAMASATQEPVPEIIETRCRTLWPKYREPLLASLDARMTERTKNLAKALQERSERDIGKMRAIMLELQKTIQAELDGKDRDREIPRQLHMYAPSDYAPHEKEQWERDRGALLRRLEEIPEEIERESEHIRSRFSNPSPRLFPVAVTWLIPRRAVVEIRGGRP